MRFDSPSTAQQASRLQQGKVQENKLSFAAGILCLEKGNTACTKPAGPRLRHFSLLFSSTGSTSFSWMVHGFFCSAESMNGAGVLSSFTASFDDPLICIARCSVGWSVLSTSRRPTNSKTWQTEIALYSDDVLLGLGRKE